MTSQNLNKDDIPASFRHLVPLAESWGQDPNFVNRVFDADRKTLETLLSEISTVPIDLWDEWLAGDSTDEVPPDVYIAFSTLRLIEELAQVVLKQRSYDSQLLEN